VTQRECCQRRGEVATTLIGLTEFLLARIGEDKAAASAVKDIGVDVWDVRMTHRPLDLDPTVTHSTDDERTTLLQRFDPARVLAECDAMQLIVAIHSAYEPGGEPVYSPDWLEERLVRWPLLQHRARAHHRAHRRQPHPARARAAVRRPPRLKERPMESPTAKDEPGSGLTQRSAGPVFVDFEVLAHRQNALFEGLTPVHEEAALVSFVGTGITDPNRYENATAAYNHLRFMAPTHEGALIQVFNNKLHEESEGGDFLYLHFADDPHVFRLPDMRADRWRS
jgi:hypothetical protein